MIFAKNFARNYEKRIIHGTSVAWSMSHFSQQSSKPANQRTSVLYFRFSDFLVTRPDKKLLKPNPVKCTKCTSFFCS